MSLRPETEERFSRYVESVLEANGCEPGYDPMARAARSFAVDPTVQQTLIDRVQQDDEGLLGKFNNITVKEIKGQKVFMGTSGKIISSTTDTESGDVRAPYNPLELALDEYECTRTDFDPIIPFTLLDNWAKFDNFEERIGKWLVKEFRNDRLKVGFNGIARAPTSNRNANPLGEDVNKGWLQRIREEAPGQVINEIVADSDAITFGDGGDYRSIDMLVIEAYNDLIPRYHRTGGNLVVFVGDGLLSDRHFKLADQNVPTEQLAAEEIIRRARVGNLPAVSAPWFPEGTMLITSYDNLSRYEQEGSRRRKVEIAEQRRGYVSWEQFNEAFVVEDYERSVLLEQITPFVAADPGE